MNSYRMAAILACGFALAAVSHAALAQGWPAKSLRVIVPLPAGVGVDSVVRTIAPGLAERLKQPVVVENRPGVGGNIAMEFVAKSPPDGYTLLLAVTGLVTNPHLYTLNYDPVRDLVPVTQLLRTHFVLVTHPSLPVASVGEILELARARPGAVTCAHASGALHIACAWFKAASRADFNLVPYKGALQALNDVIGGHADLGFSFVPNVLPHVETKRVRVLATTLPRRGGGPFGGLPTMAETLPGFELVSWMGIMAPAGTPRDVIERLNREIAVVVEQPDVRRRIVDGGSELAHGTPDAFAEIIRRDYAKFEKIIRGTGIRAQ